MFTTSRSIFAVLIIIIISSCSTKKNTMVTRTYHQVTSRYNTYFNGRESFRSGVRKTERQFRYDYNKILPVFLYTDPQIARSVAPEMDRAIGKASKVITNKSITAKPKEGGGLFGSRDEDFLQKNEYNRWVIESYLLAGKAHFYKHDFIPAAQTFLFITRDYGKNQARHEAKIWLARTYSERQRFSEAKMVCDEMVGDANFPRELKGELYATIADLHLKQDEYLQGIENLLKATDLSRRKEERIRFTFILAQLYERTGNYPLASEYYDRVIRMNPPYEMIFNARIAQSGVFRAGRGETGRMINELEKMLRDEKNQDYLDQIYYALGNIYMHNNDEEKAISMYSLSTRSYGVNPSQKAVSYLALADIYFKHPDYLTAAAWYDSAVINMEQNFPGRKDLEEKNSILQELTGNIRLYQLEDSVQVLAAMTEAERNSKIDEIIARAKQDESEARRRELLAQQAGQFRSARTSQAARYQAERTGGGNWYFYNPSAVSFGQNEFESLWGKRRLEDNWRRSSRQVLSSVQFAFANDTDEPAGEVEEEIIDTGSREFYLMNIPLTEQDMEASHQRLQEALYSMAVIYNEELNDYKHSVEAYRKLIERYPDGTFLLPSWYDLYTIHLNQQDHQESDRYKNLILTNFPDSPYASILTNPDYFREYEQQMQEAALYYEKTFELFREYKYDQIEERVGYAFTRWPGHHLLPRFEYLRVLSYGSKGNMPLFRDMLSAYINNYPETEMTADAKQFLAYLDDDFVEIIQKTEIAIVQDIYQKQQDGAHYFVMIVDNRQELINRLVFNFVNFNVDHFARLNLNVTSEPFTTNYRLMRVTGLPDSKLAVEYLNRFNESNEVFAEIDSREFPNFVISDGNYEIFLKDRNIGSYMNFFEEEYLRR
jgi:tetratricopeptide (TPR) repeat protein